MEIGSFIEMQFDKKKEYYSLNKNIARLNSGRSAIYHSLRVLGYSTIWLPYYQCDTVRQFLKKKNINLKYYHIDKEFNPVDLNSIDTEAVLLVNYYGIMSYKRMKHLSIKYKNVIIDNSQAFFCKPIKNCMNVYSCRKFFGVPDGAYVIGKYAEKYINEYPKCFSSDTSVFLLQRIEYGCEGKAYGNKVVNECRINNEDVMQMSELTKKILCGTNYRYIKQKRRNNFNLINKALKGINHICPKKYYDFSCIPMVYPFVYEDDTLLEKLQKEKHFQGHWWSYLIEEMVDNEFEYWISRYIVPITIDQRYDKNDYFNLLRIINNEYIK